MLEIIKNMLSLLSADTVDDSEVMGYFRAEYKRDALAAYKYYIATGSMYYLD